MMEIIFETDEYLATTGGALPAFVEGQSRDETRIQGPFPARVKGSQATGARFVTDTIIENLSAQDCCVRLVERVEPGDCLFVATRINKAVVSLRGKVLHIMLRADGTWGVILRITRYRFVHRRKNSD
jgi:hypothetical protein